MRYSDFFDSFQSLVDSISHDSDEVSRLKSIARLLTESRTVLIKERDRAAYELRTRLTSADAQQRTGISRVYVDTWARRHQKNTGAPPILRKARKDMRKAADLSSGSSQSKS